MEQIEQIAFDKMELERNIRDLIVAFEEKHKIVLTENLYMDRKMYDRDRSILTVSIRTYIL